MWRPEEKLDGPALKMRIPGSPQSVSRLQWSLATWTGAIKVIHEESMEYFDLKFYWDIIVCIIIVRELVKKNPVFYDQADHKGGRPSQPDHKNLWNFGPISPFIK